MKPWKWKTRYVVASVLSAIAHAKQTRKSRLVPYHLHPNEVASEVARYSGLEGEELWKALILSLLHDTVEDTWVTRFLVRMLFGWEMRRAVCAVSKNPQATIRVMDDSLNRIVNEPRWVAVVKMADRKCNLKDIPPMWTSEKWTQYLDEAEEIATRLRYASERMYLSLMRLVTRRRQEML